MVREGDAPGGYRRCDRRVPAGGRFEYFNDEARTAEAYRGDCFALGDVGRSDQDGHPFPTDSSASLIISGRVNVYPPEIAMPCCSSTPQ